MRKVAPILIGLGCFLLIFGAKLWLLHRSGSDLPTLDQWDSEGEITLRPWLEGRLEPGHILLPHNEHRIITAKLYVLGLFIANGQWDGYVETTVNAIIHAAFALAWLWLACRWLAGIWRILFGALLLSLFLLPFADDNTRVGFQVQVYFLLFFSLGHLVLTLEASRVTWRWVAGQICGGLALASMGSGFLSSVAVAAVLVHRLLRERERSAVTLAGAVVALAFIALGLVSRTPAPYHDWMKAQSVGQFIHGMLQLVAWPGSALFPWSVVLAAPMVIFIARRWPWRAWSPEDRVLAGLQGWILAQFAATAYSRAVQVLTSRYLDLVALNLLLGFLFIARELSGRARQVVAGVWLVAVLAGLGWETHRTWVHEAVPNIDRQRRREAHVRAFLQTGDPSHLRTPPVDDLPYPNAEILLARLTTPLARVMPAGVRQAEAIIPPDGAPSQLPSGLVAPDFIPIVSSWTPAPADAAVRWRSARQPANPFPFLRLQVAGDLGAPGRELRLVVRSDTETVTVIPDAAPGLRWKTVNVASPPGEWWLEIEDEDPVAWFAVTAPVTLARGSWLAAKVIKHHVPVALGGAVLLLGGLLLSGYRSSSPAAYFSRNRAATPARSTSVGN